ncbi:TPA: hypothetical protein ACVU5O_004623 [Vibrio parahaemolyticus]
MFQLVLKFVKNDKNQPLAIWIQTLFLAIGVVFGLVQISYLVDSYKISANKEYYKLYTEYSKNISSKVEKLNQFYIDVRNDRYTEAYTLERSTEIDEIQIEIWKFNRKLADCSRLGICAEKQSHALICNNANKTYFNIKKVGNDLAKYPALKYKNTLYNHYYYISEYCGFWDEYVFFFIKNGYTYNV